MKEVPSLELVKSCKDAFEAMAVLQETEIDLLFLDINMPKLSGFSLLKSIQRRPNVIVTTAYSEHAVEGFELSVNDYLLKPFSFERFLRAVMKVQTSTVAKAAQPMPLKAPGQTTESIFVKSDKKIVKINLDDIQYIEAYGNYIKIYTDVMILTPKTLTEFLAELPENFVRIHKSFAINFEKLKLIQGNQVILQDGTKLSIGKSFRKDVFGRV
ncbi:MAG: LytTR family DNA-binding domain-containing protein [Flavobacteriales bacterium]|nr:LytTR family DNA-binding domain-containing protein [Flavobacteriales bacterium]